MAEVKSKEPQAKPVGAIQNPYGAAGGSSPYNPYGAAGEPKPASREGEARSEPKEPEQAKPIAVRLVPVENTDKPVFTNYASINVSPGVVFIDFGFFEPAMLAALPHVTRQGGKLPEELSARLAVRVAMGYDALAALHQKISELVAAFNTQAAEAGKPS